MILPDVNVLVYAYRREAERHERYAAWLQEVVDGGDELALNDLSLLGFVRIVTNRRIFSQPDDVATALGFVEALAGAARARWLAAGPAPWERFLQLAQADSQISGPLVPDAFLAALALTHGCRVATADRGFARYVGLNWFDPAA